MMCFGVSLSLLYFLLSLVPRYKARDPSRDAAKAPC
jgi:hypothetical protein